MRNFGKQFKPGDRVKVTENRFNPFDKEESYKKGEHGVVTQASNSSTVCTVRLDGDYFSVASVYPLHKKPIPHRIAHISILHLQTLKEGHRNSPEPQELDDASDSLAMLCGGMDASSFESKLLGLTNGDLSRRSSPDTPDYLFEADVDEWWKGKPAQFKDLSSVHLHTKVDSQKKLDSRRTSAGSLTSADFSEITTASASQENMRCSSPQMSNLAKCGAVAVGLC